MSRSGAQRVPFRRERDGRTNYRQRRKLLKGRVPIAVVRRSNSYLTLQLVEFAPRGDRVLASVHSSELRKAGLDGSAKSVTAAYLAGHLLALRARARGVRRSVLHLGRHASTPGSRLYAAVRGAREGGLEIPADPEVLPDDERLDKEVVNAVKPKLESLAGDGKRP